jgi:hypothetical protein
MGNKQRDRLWPIFQSVQRLIADRGFVTDAGVFRALAEHYAGKAEKPFHFGVAELRFLAAIAPATPNALFFAGDLGQRIIPAAVLLEGARNQRAGALGYPQGQLSHAPDPRGRRSPDGRVSLRC